MQSSRSSTPEPTKWTVKRATILDRILDWKRVEVAQDKGAQP